MKSLAAILLLIVPLTVRAEDFDARREVAAGIALDRARAFLQDVELNSTANDFLIRFVAYDAERNEFVFRGTHTFLSTPIYSSELTISVIGQDAKILSDRVLRTSIVVGVNPGVSSESAETIARSKLPMKNWHARSELWIIPHGTGIGEMRSDDDRLVWMTSVRHELEAWRFIVDAHTGRLLVSFEIDAFDAINVQ